MTTGLLAGLLVLGVANVPVEKDGTWVEVKSPAFVVMTDGGASAARRVIKRFERIRSAFAAAIPTAKLSGERELLIVAARSEKSLRSLVPEWWEKKDGIRPSTVHETGRDHTFILVRTDLREDDDESYHAAHWGFASHLIGLNVPHAPLWAYRGLADFYARTTVQKSQILVGRAAVSHIRTLRERGLMPVEALWAVDRQSPEYLDRNHLLRFDAESWTLVHYLMLGDKGAHRANLASFLASVSQGRDPVEAARATLGDPAALDQALASYIMSRGYYMQPVDAEVDTKVATSPERPMSSAEALTLRAAVHLASERFPDAHACLDEALRLDPKLAWAHEIRGALAWAEEDPVEARAAVEQALALEPGRPVALRLQERLAGPPTLKGAQRLCDAGELEACARLGAWLIDGNGTAADPLRGVALIEKACAGGDAEGCRHLAWRYRQGTGLPANPTRAMALLERACEAGDTDSCLAAAADLQQGQTVPADPAAAARLFDTACTRGERRACIALAWILQRGEGAPRDLERAAALYQDGCQEGDGASCTRLGLLYVSEDGLPRDPSRARDLLEKGCDLGDPQACSNLQIVKEILASESKARRR